MHHLSSIDDSLRTAVCSICGPVRVKLRDSSSATLTGKWRCITVHRTKNDRRLYPYKIYKKEKCERCGFVPEHSSQLDVDHIDGDNSNNQPSNLQTLCSNCHRIKTYTNKDWENKNNGPSLSG